VAAAELRALRDQCSGRGQDRVGVDRAKKEAKIMLESGEQCSPPFAKCLKDGAPAVLVSERK
jgi:hypothetical protein